MRSAEIFCDFDGTITRVDCVDLILEQLSEPGWEEIEERWISGEIGSRQCMAEQVALLSGGWSAIESVLDSVEIEPSFPDFATWCRASGIRFTIVSDGLDCAIDYILTREGITVDAIIANHLAETDDDRLRLSFPYAQTDCGSGVCKCRIVDGIATAAKRIYIGDGRSDFCSAGKTDLLFAKNKLLAHCQKEGIACIPFTSFKEVRQVIESAITISPTSFLYPFQQPEIRRLGGLAH